MIICTSISPNHSNSYNQAIALKSWQKYGKCYSLNTRSEIETLHKHFSEATFIETTRTVKKLIGKPLVSINAFFDFALEKGEDLFLINSDIVLESLPELKSDGVTIFSRYDYSETTYENAKMFVYGFDAFFFPKQFLNIFPPSVYALGMAWHDLSTPLHVIKNEIPLYYPKGKFAFHKLHGVQYSEDEWNHIGEIFRAEFRLPKPPPLGNIATNIMNRIRLKFIS